MKLDMLMRRMKGKGYILAEMDFGLPDMDDKQKLQAFCHHSKGLWSPAGIFKNLPMCSDCHKVSTSLGLLAMKITARAANRLHPFKNSFMFLL
jgi:hypothetical protein